MKLFIICIACVAAGYFMRYSQELDKQEKAQDGRANKSF